MQIINSNQDVASFFPEQVKQQSTKYSDKNNINKLHQGVEDGR
jgi:hypothetical protein